MKNKSINPKHKNRKRVCGICGKRYLETEMERDDGSDTGWLCCYCLMGIHPEYEEFGEY